MSDLKNNKFSVCVEKYISVRISSALILGVVTMLHNFQSVFYPLILLYCFDMHMVLLQNQSYAIFCHNGESYFICFMIHLLHCCAIHSLALG